MASDLEKVREKIAQGWTQRTDARTLLNDPTSPRGDDAVCWCLAGAAVAVGMRLENLGSAIGVGPSRMQIELWNDVHGRTQAEVLAVLDAALAREVQPS